jgi:hypothetical protein
MATAPLSTVYGKQESPLKGSNARLEITRCIPAWPRKVYIQWNIRNPISTPSYTFKVERSGGHDGPWELLAEDLVDTYFYVDDAILSPHDGSSMDAMSLERKPYYRITATPGDLEAIGDTWPALDHRRQGIHYKLTRDAMRYLKVGTGTEVAIFKRRRWGEKCPICLTSTGQSTRAHCSTCFGTTFVGGYWNPVYTYAQRRPSPIQIQTVPQGDVESNVLQVLMPHIPIVDVLDVMVFLRDNSRYEVKSSTPTLIHSLTVHQELVVSELARSAREYGLKADNWHAPPWF